jgi:hypothetical protein
LSSNGAPREVLMGRIALTSLMTFTASVLLAQTPRVQMVFAAQHKNPAFEGATMEYRAIWAAEGAHIIEGMEQITTLRFPEKEVKAEIFEGASNAGLSFNRDGVPTGIHGPIVFRASYQPDEKKGTLIHELGHRMNVQLKKRPRDLDEHRLLFLYLYDLYVNLYGQPFADRQVAFGRSLRGLYDYDAAWTWALAMTKGERAARFADVVKANRK